jgi:pyruvate formate lyase activating enzyme
MNATVAATVVSTNHWHRLDDGRIQCDLCPRLCRLREGQRGFCFARACAEGRLVLTSYGRLSSLCVDPIEKKPLYHFLPGTAVLSLGTAGCNLACGFCQNWSISRSRDADVNAEAAPPETVAAVAARLGCPSVAFTYNDPVVFHEYAIDVAAACRAQGIKTVAVTAGYVCPRPRTEFYRLVDAANVDLKGLSERFYRELCAAHVRPVLDTLLYLRHETRVWLEITNLVIPGRNDSDAALRALSRWVVARLGPDVPLHFTAFRPAFRMWDAPPTAAETLRRARHVARGEGIRYAYVGNIHDPAGESTCCHGCERKLIGRRGYALTDWQLRDGRCRFCSMPCAGVFEPEPGRWGATSLPVRLRTVV